MTPQERRKIKHLLYRLDCNCTCDLLYDGHRCVHVLAKERLATTMTEKQLRILVAGASASAKAKNNQINPVLKEPKPMLCLTREARVALLIMRYDADQELFDPRDITAMPSDIAVTTKNTANNVHKETGELVTEDDYRDELFDDD